MELDEDLVCDCDLDVEFVVVVVTSLPIVTNGVDCGLSVWDLSEVGMISLPMSPSNALTVFDCSSS